MSSRPFVPDFLQKFDDQLLRSKPATWATRTHLVIWFTILFSLALAFCCYFAFFDSKQYYATEGWISFVGIISSIGFIFWLMFLLRFNVFKRYGNWFAWDGIKGFILYFVCIGCMVSVCFIPSAVQTWRANQQFAYSGMVKDINEMNVSACKLEYNLLPKDWTKDTCWLAKKHQLTESPYRADVDTTSEMNSQVTFINKHWIDTIELKTLLATTDSVVRLNDTVYVFYNCPNYIFVQPSDASFNSSYQLTIYNSPELLNSVKINKIISSTDGRTNLPTLRQRLAEMRTKYEDVSTSSLENENYNLYNDNYENAIRKKYHLASINNGINNIMRKKTHWVNNWDDYLRIFYYTTLILALFVFMFRHNSVKAFTVTLLSGLLICILTGLTIAISHGNEQAILYFMIGYYILFIFLSFSISKVYVRKILPAIGLNLFLIMTPFFPLICLATYMTAERNYYRNRQNGNAYAIYLENYIWIAELAGFIIFLLLLQPVFRKLYRKWYAAPED